MYHSTCYSSIKNKKAFSVNLVRPMQPPEVLHYKKGSIASSSRPGCRFRRLYLSWNGPMRNLSGKEEDFLPAYVTVKVWHLIRDGKGLRLLAPRWLATRPSATIWAICLRISPSNLRDGMKKGFSVRDHLSVPRRWWGSHVSAACAPYWGNDFLSLRLDLEVIVHKLCCASNPVMNSFNPHLIVMNRAIT